MKRNLFIGLLLSGLCASTGLAQTPLGTAFAYQGQLKEGGMPYNGTATLQFQLYDADAGGMLVGTNSVPNVPINNGLFTVYLDFGGEAFFGDARWLEIAVYKIGVGYVTLTPRQPLTAAPYALYALSAATVGNADTLDGQHGSFYQNASNLNAGTLPSGRLAGVYSNALTLNNTGNNLTGTGAGLTALNASNVTSGTLANARTTGTALNTPSTLVLRDVSGNFAAGTITGSSSSTYGYGVAGYANAASGETEGVHGESASPDGKGVYGLANANNGVNYGGWFESDSTSGTGVYGTADANTGITYGVSGRSASTFGYGVYGRATAATGENYGGCFDSDSTSGRGVEGWAFADTGTTYGGRFVSESTSGRGVEGWAAATTGTTYGGRFESESTSGIGVCGYADAASGTNYGVYGLSDSTSGRGVYGYANAATGTTYGGRFESASTSGFGVFGLAYAGTGSTSGGWFESASTDGWGVGGYAAAATGSTRGVYGQSDSTSGYGIYGKAAATTGAGATYGVYGVSSSTSGRGVYGSANASTGTIYGVQGYASTAAGGYAVYASGDMGASGTKPFRIDHPDDPENKYLLHYAAESPEVINFYRGSVVLDGEGQAVVELPHYFAKINKTPSYQLTAVGAPMPMLHVAEEIDEAALSAGAKAGPSETAPVCSFRIAGGKPGAKVSWEVKAVRNDRWVQKRGTPVEVEKQNLEKGTYQHPELYGQPPEKGLNYEAERERPSPERPSHERPDRPVDDRETPLHAEALALPAELQVDRAAEASSETAKQQAIIEADEPSRPLPEPVTD